MASIAPIDVPSQAELWRRVRLAQSILNHRTLVPRTTADLLRRVLDGQEITMQEGEVS